MRSAGLAPVRVTGAGDDMSVCGELNGGSVEDGIGGDSALGKARVRSIEGIIDARIRGRGQRQEIFWRDWAASATEAGWLNELTVDEVDAVGEPGFH